MRVPVRGTRRPSSGRPVTDARPLAICSRGSLRSLDTRSLVSRIRPQRRVAQGQRTHAAQTLLRSLVWPVFGLVAAVVDLAFGVVETGDELKHCCVMPWHDDANPSAYLNVDSLVYACLAGETQVKTLEHGLLYRE